MQIAPTPFFADRGCHIRIEGIVRCLTELGHTNRVCTYHHGRDIAGVDTLRISPIKNYTQTAAGPSKYKLWADWKLLWLCVKQYRQQKPDVIHAHLHEGLLIGLIVKLMFFWRRTPLIADMQGSLTGELDSHNAFRKLPFLRMPTHFLERLLMLAADRIICSSSHALHKIKAEFNPAPAKISLVQDGADPAPNFTAEQGSALRQSLGLEQAGDTLVVYSGALLDSKGLAELKELILNCADIQGLRFMCIGYPVENLQSFLNENKLQDSCLLTGQIDFARLPEYLSIADIAVDPKLSNAGEGSGKMLNYMAAGLAIVAFDTANNRDFLPSSTPLARDVHELTELLKGLHADAKCRASLGKQNSEHFEQHYSWQISKQQLAKVYASL